MASSRSVRYPLASNEWIKEEKTQASIETLRHVEDFGYAVTHELEWLNERMAEVYSIETKTLTDIFKTPGRLRAKTPYTTRRLNAITPRAPLGDIFAPNTQTTPSQKISVIDHAPKFEIHDDVENQEPSKSTSRSKSPKRAGKSGNIDSGYHGMTEDELENELNARAGSNGEKLDPSNDRREHDIQIDTAKAQNHEDTAHSSEGSFASARESVDVRNMTHIIADTNEEEEVPILHSPASEVEEQSEPISKRKSSFNFSSLPAREPLLTKKSIGARPSYLDGAGQNQVLGRAAHTALQEESHDQPKSTTQLLHDRITMLGQARIPRPSKSLAPIVQYPELPIQQVETSKQSEVLTQQPDVLRQHTNHIATTKQADDDVRPSTSQTDQHIMSFAETTPTGSPAGKKHIEGPLSASRNKLMSVFKSARSIFASSASTSAAAKLEAHNTPLRPSPSREISHESKIGILNIPGALKSDASLARTLSRPISVVSTSPSRKLRSSDELQRQHEKDLKMQQKAADELEKAREKERVKAAKEQDERERTAKADIAKKAKEAQKTAKAAEKVVPLAGKLRGVARPVRPMAQPKVLPAPVNVKTTSQLQGESSQSTSRPSSAHNNVKVSTMQSTKSGARALEAAARKKEMEDKEKARRQQQKRELERKRAATKAEEDRKAQEAQRVAQEARLVAQKQAEAKQREQLQRQQEETQRLQAAQEIADTIARERAQQQSQSRNDVTGTIRQLGQKTVEASLRQIAPNPAKPAKRPFEGEDIQPRPGLAHQQNEGKRRKTDEMEEQNTRTSVMAPPKRPSTMRKETLTRLPHGYVPAPTYPPTTLFKTSQLNPKAPMQLNQTVQMSTARIPFADASKPAVAMPSGYPQDGGAYPKFKTPVRPPQATAKSVGQSSPMYPNGDSIALPEIATDSEDEDDEDEDTGFRAPSWVASPALRDMLTQQQLVDPETVFGPIAELRMEEVFKGGKNPERLKKFRDRGSSAAWVQNGDAVTSAEKRRDMEMRERVAREGGWRYQPGL